VSWCVKVQVNRCAVWNAYYSGVEHGDCHACIGCIGVLGSGHGESGVQHAFSMSRKERESLAPLQWGGGSEIFQTFHTVMVVWSVWGP
jgi:hypothetical protein